MEWVILTIVLWVNAILKMGRDYNKTKKREFDFWNIQPFLFPVLMSIALILMFNYIIGINGYCFCIGIGLIFEFSSFLFKKIHMYKKVR